jgi:ribosomal protein S27E
MGKVKCQCLNCNHYQWIIEDSESDCENCGWIINASEDYVED